MKCEMHRCCCFNNSKDASFASGIYTTVISLMYIICCAVLHDISESSLHLHQYEYKIYILILIIVIVAMIIFFILSLILLYGIIKTKRLALIPWMVWMIIVITLDCIGIILIIIASIIFAAFFSLFLFASLPFIGLNITSFIVVKTYYQTLSAVPVTVDEEAVKYSSLKD